MSTKSANDEKKARAIRETNEADFLKVINEVVTLVTSEEFNSDICKDTANGLYKFSTTMPQDMTGVKKTSVHGLTWYKIPTSDYRLSFTSYIQFRLTSEAKARSAAIKSLSSLSLEQLNALMESLNK